jgi:cellulose synthase/poly-beta-1,6-N-acetylglucosamine synthase-like glycosyltransferase
LRRLGGWDAFNVTEDADLGVRMSRFRHRAGVLDSRTREEAPVTFNAWLAQRTRWMKGWMQTLIVHNRHPVAFIRDIGWRGFIFVQIYVGGLILAPLLHTVFLLSSVLALVTGAQGGIESWLLLVLIGLGYAGAFAIVVAGLLHDGNARLLPAQALLPVCWLLHSLATVRATIDLLTRPFHWHKTTHGRTRVNRQAPQTHASASETAEAAAE